MTERQRFSEETSQINIGGELQNDLLGMKVILGKTYLTSINISNNKRAHLPIILRLIISNDTSLYDRLQDKTRQNSDNFSEKTMNWFLEQVLGDITNGMVQITEDFPHPDNDMLNLMANYGNSGILTVVNAHGGVYDGGYALETPIGIQPLENIIDMIQQRDAKKSSSTTIVLSSCNEEGILLSSTKANLFYRTGIAAGIFRSGQLVFSKQV